MDIPDKVAQRCLLFVTYVEKNQDLGIDGSNEERPYISREKLAEYWNGNAILSLLGANDRQVDVQRISMTHLQVFSILVWISKYQHNWIDYIPYFISSNFTDSHLPLTSPPKEGERCPYDQRSCPFPDNPEGRDAWSHFLEEQWRFVPLQFRPSDGTQIERVHEGRNDVNIRQIRPITVIEQLHPKSSNSAKIYKVQPHEASGLLVNHPIILKEYPVGELTGQFEQEHKVYTAISNNMHDSPDHRDAHFLRYYGAFLQGNKYVLLLEYCSEGTLLDLFQKCWYLPRTREEAQVLWAAAQHLLEGLDFLHSKGENSLVVHQDIKPANIFVFKDTQPGTPDRLFFKLGDFGMSSTSDPSARGEAEGPDNQGSRIYSAPEISAWTAGDQHIPRRTNWQSDIWSVGCVLYEFAIWMAAFERGRIEFRRARAEATERIPHIGYGGYRGAFHDCKALLPIVEAQVNEMEKLGTPVASLSGELMRVVLQYMLQPNPDRRAQARRLKLYLMDQLNKIAKPVSETTSFPSTPPDLPQSVAPSSLITSLTTPDSRHRLPPTPSYASPTELQALPYSFPSQSPMTSPVNEHATDFRLSHSYSPYSPGMSYPTMSPVSMSAITQRMSTIHVSNDDASTLTRTHRDSNYPRCTVEEVMIQDWHKQPKKKRDRSKLPGMSKALGDLQDRDQYFIIDNSESMIGCWEKVTSTTLALASIVQDIDPDEIDFFCTNNPNPERPNPPLKTKDCKKVEEWLNEKRPFSNIGDCHMENRLDSILPDLVTKATKRKTWDRVRGRQRTKGINVYVLTNGVWEDRNSENVDAAKRSIRAIVELIKRHSLPQNFLSIQFVRFGEHPIGKSRLQWLDDKLKDYMPDEWDIVDTTPHTGSVWKMLIGATSAFEDNIEEEIEQTNPFVS